MQENYGNYKKKPGRGGKRPGAGAKRKHESYSVKITPRHAELLKKWGGGDLSAGLRWLVDVASPLVGPALVELGKVY